MTKSKIKLLEKDEKQDLFFKGYRPNFYFRTDDPVMEKPLSESIVERVRDVIKDDKAE